jgi:hypothetical protein
MLLFEGERLFSLTINPECEDSGMTALRDYASGEPWVSTVLWAIAAVALGGVDHLLRTLASSGPHAIGFKRGVHVWIVSGWVVATTFSQMSLMLLGRAQVSYVVMFIHVAFELLHIAVAFFHRWGWGAHVLLTGALATFALGSAMSMPCAVARSLTSLGAVLDTFNFVACFLTSRGDRTRAFVIVHWAFFAHATYIWAFMTMSSIPTVQNTGSLTLLRAYGVLANSIAVSLGTLGVLHAIVPVAFTDRRMVRLVRRVDGARDAEGAQGEGEGECTGEWRHVGVGSLRLAHTGGSDEAVLSSRCSVPDDARHRLALHLAGALGSVAHWRGGRLFWLGSEVCTSAPDARPGESWVQPTEAFLWTHRIAAWALFLVLLDLQLAAGRSYIPAFVIAWAGPALIFWVALCLLAIWPRVTALRLGLTP